MGRKIKLPVGIEDFKEIRQEEFYYIDKTRLIEQFLDRWRKVGKGKSFYQTKAIWENFKYEYAALFF